MLSKKMAFSLMSLITLLALAFVVPTTMAADDFDATFSVTNRVYNTDIVVTLTFGSNVGLTNAQGILNTDLTKNLLSVRIVDKNGVVTDLTGVTSPVIDSADITAKDINLGVTGDQTDGKTFKFTILATNTDSDDRQILLAIKAGVAEADPLSVKSSKKGSATVGLMGAIAVNPSRPNVVSIQRLRPGSQTVVSAFQEAKLTQAPFDVRIVFTELPHDFVLAKITVENGVASNLVVGVPFAWYGVTVANNTATVVPATDTNREHALRPHPSEGMYEHSVEGALAGVLQGMDGNVPLPTGADEKYHQYRVTITPHNKTADFEVKVSITEFHDNASPFPNVYKPFDIGNKPNGREQLRLNVTGAARNLKAGTRVVLPKGIVIPATGYLVITQNSDGSEVIVPTDSPKAPDATKRTPVQMIYNVQQAATLPNLATQFVNGVVLDLESQHAGLVISEVMWGEDVSLNPSSNSQYIELYNPGGAYTTADNADHTPDVNEALTLIFYAPNEFSAVEARTAAGDLPTGVTDRIGTLDADGSYWDPVGIGQSGRSGKGEGEATGGRVSFVPTVPIVSMYRAMDAAGAVEDGQTAATWMTSAGPKSANFNLTAIGIRHGTPGAATDATTTPADTAAEEKAAADKAAAAVKKTESTGTMPEDGQIYISEIMFAGGGILPTVD